MFFTICFFHLFSLGASPQFLIFPKEPLLEDVISIQVTGFNPHDKVTIQATLIDEIHRKWQSHAAFLADNSGKIDLTSQAPLEGSYAGVDPMGIFWSMRLDPQEKNLLNFEHQSLKPIVISLNCFCNGVEMTKTTISRNVVKKGVHKISVDENGVKATLYLPEGKGPFPGIIVLSGSGMAIPPDSYIAQFANQGYGALGLQYHGIEGLPSDFINIPIEYFGKAIDWIKKQKNIDTDNLAMVGFSMGGTSTLLTASFFPDIKAVAVISARGIVIQQEYCPEESKAQSPFAFKGTPLPFLKANFSPPTEENAKTLYCLNAFLPPVFKASPERLEETTIKVENINGPILMIAGLDDRIAGSFFLENLAYNRLIKHQFPHPFDFITFPGAGHYLIGAEALPYNPCTSFLHPYPPLTTLYNAGGSPFLQSKAIVDTWKQVFHFLNKQTSKTDE